jgi:hypothetical protein
MIRKECSAKTPENPNGRLLKLTEAFPVPAHRCTAPARSRHSLLQTFRYFATLDALQKKHSRTNPIR